MLGPKLRDANLGMYLSHLGLELHVGGWNNEVTGCRTERTQHWGSRCDTPGASFPAHCQLFSGHWRSERAWCEKLCLQRIDFIIINTTWQNHKQKNLTVLYYIWLWICGLINTSVLAIAFVWIKLSFPTSHIEPSHFCVCESLKFKPKSGRG